MKIKHIQVAALLMAATMMTTSCIGSFSLFNKYEKWQCNMTKSKILNGIVGFILQPIVGGVCLLVDSVVLNTIEFWSGNNPVASVGKTQHIMGSDGVLYAVKTLKDGYEITSPMGDIVKLQYNASDNSWSMMQDGQVTNLFRFNADGTIKVDLPDGSQMDVALNADGLSQVQQAVDANFWAMR